MNTLGEIALEGMEFFAHHGYFDEEQTIGNKYSVDIYLTAPLHQPAQSDNLKDTIDYGVIYQIVAQEMQIKSRLLEHVAYRIIEKIKARFSQTQKITVQVSKYNPPVGGLVFRSKIRLEETF